MAEKKQWELIDRRKILDMSDEEILKIMSDDWAEADAHWKPHFDDFRRYEKAYNMKQADSKPTERESGGLLINPYARASNFHGITTAIVDTIYAIITESIFSVDDYFFLVPTSGAWDHPSHGDYLKYALQWDCGPTRAKLRYHFGDWLMQAIKFKWAVARVGYRYAGKNVKVPAKSMADMITNKLGTGEGVVGSALKGLVERVLKHDKKLSGRPAFEIKYDPTGDQRPEIEVFNTFNTRPDPQAVDFDDNCRYFMDELSLSWTEIKTNIKSDENPQGNYEITPVQQLLKLYGSSSSPPVEQKSAEDEVQFGKKYPDQSRDLVTLRRWRNQYAEFVSDQNFQVLLRKRPKDGWDCCKMTYWPRTKRWEGYSLIERIEKENYEINALSNLRLDNINFSISAIAIINKTLFQFDKNQNDKVFPGKTFWVDGDPRQAIHYERAPDVTQTSMQEIAFRIQVIERIAATGENAQGSYFTGGKRTATEAEYVQTGLAARMAPVTKRIERDNLRWMLSAVLEQEELNLSEETKFVLQGGKGIIRGSISPELLSKYGPNIQAEPVGSQFHENRYMDRMARMEAAQFFSSVPQMERHINWLTLTRQIAETAKFRDIDDLIADDPMLNTSTPQDIETYVIVTRGDLLIPHDADDHEEHLAQIEEFMSSEEYRDVPPANQLKLETHKQLHEEMLQEIGQVKPGPNPQAQTSNIATQGNAQSAMNPQSQSPANQSFEQGGM